MVTVTATREVSLMVTVTATRGVSLNGVLTDECNI